MKRNKERIDPTLDRIRQVWYSNPDMRLMQLLENVSIVTDRTGIIAGQGHGHCCMYYMEDSVLVERLGEVYGEG